MTGGTQDSRRKFASALLPVLMFIIASISPLLTAPIGGMSLENNPEPSHSDSNPYWTGLEQPWAQFARTPTHNASMPAHGPNGGPGYGSVNDVTTLGTIEEPGVNWAALDEGSDLYGSIIGDFSTSVTAPEAAKERCADGNLFAVMVHSDTTDTFLSLAAGDDAKIAWEVNIGDTKDIRSTPIIVDVDQDGRQEIVLVYDTDTALNIEVWSPVLTCSESGWQKSGHENERYWSYTDVDYRIGIQSPHTPTSQSNHLSITQPLVADLALDGSPELVLAVVDETSNDPTVLSYSLTSTAPSEADWEVALDRGTHPSSPAWAALDSTTTAVVLTTIDSNGGSMWIWRIDGASGSLDWERVAVQGTDSDSDAPRLRLPGPVIAQLDADDAPEMILTVPTDANGRTSGLGARFIGMEMTSTTEIFNFRTPNGYADAEPLVVDTTGDGLHDRLCWVTWYSESQFSFNRQGLAGCHDISDDTPFKEWSRDLQRGAGNDNDEIAVASPIALDIDGAGAPEIIVPFGMRLYAFDGNTGASADINDAWSSPLAMPHRVWASPAAADMDGDGTIDLLVGDTLISQMVTDLAPLADGRGISFNPANPDPGALVTVTGSFSNIGTLENEDDVDAVLTMNGDEIARERFSDAEPVSPSGEGGPLTFSATFTATLGEHVFSLVLDVNDNLTEARKDNNNASATLTIVEPFVARIDPPLEAIRVAPGGSQSIAIEITATGSRSGDWTLTTDDAALPEEWVFNSAAGANLNPALSPNTPVTVMFEIAVPQTALGDENSYVDLILTLDQDPTIETSLRLPLEVLRTRGLSVVGPAGLSDSNGIGRPNHEASAWLVVENLGNAQESTTSIDWTAPSWGGTPSLVTQDGNEVFSLNLGPNEDIELFATLPVPSGVQPGTSTSSMLTICIGSGEATLCQEMDVYFHASNVEFTPTHLRTLPNSTLSWSVTALLPADGSLDWNMATAQMIQSGWEWSGTGDVTVDGTTVELTGTPGTTATGTIALTLPVNAVPQRHVFTAAESTEVHHELNFSMQVLQVFRSAATILEPSLSPGESAVLLPVNETQSILLRLENPGNGEDTFLLTASVKADASMNPQPQVDFVIYNAQRTLGPLATTIATVDVVLSEDIPALAPFELEFTWTSQGEQNIAATTTLPIKAEPDYQWRLADVSFNSELIAPGEDVVVEFNITNIGNTPDVLTLTPTFTVQHAGNDTSVWSTPPTTTDVFEVNATRSLNVTFSVPDSAWFETQASLSIGLYSGDVYVGESTVEFSVVHASAWRFNLSETSLTIAPGGQNLTLNVDQMGNHPEAPWFTKAGQGWPIVLPENGAVVNPGESTTMTVFVTPPEDALAGEVGVLRIRISDGNGAGQIVQEIPVRVGQEANITIDHRGTWKVNEDGGLPTAWIANNGNDVAVMQVFVDGLPSAWSLNGSAQLVVAPGQLVGLPLMLTPDMAWNQQRFLVTIRVEHPTLGTVTHDLEVEHGEFTFHSTPVHQAKEGTLVTIELGQPIGGGLTSTDAIEIKAQTVELTMGGNANELFLESTFDESDRLSLYAVGYALPIIDVDCQLQPQAFSDLGRVELTGSVGECNIVASNEEGLRATVLLISDQGDTVQLLQDTIVLGSGENTTYDINVTGWEPSAGSTAVTVMVVDSYGRVLETATINTLSRASGWNVGIFSFTADEDLKVSVQRSSWSVLEGINCRVEINSLDSGWSAVRVIDIAEGDFPPVVTIQAPPNLKDGEQLRASLSCDAPYDIDDTPEDDEKTTYYQARTDRLVESSEIAISVVVAGVLLVVAYFAGALGTTGSKKAGKQPSTAKRQPAPESTKEPEEPEQVIEKEIDDFSFEPMPERNEEASWVEDAVQSPSMVEVIDVPDQEDHTPSGRLASMRDELTSDGPSAEGREDRMKRFFGNR